MEIEIPAFFKQFQDWFDFLPTPLDHLDQRMSQKGLSSGAQVIEKRLQRLLPRLLGQKTGRIVKAPFNIPPDGPQA